MTTKRLLDRHQTYGRVSKYLEQMTATELALLLSNIEKTGTGIGGDHYLLRRDEIPIFVKRVRLTEIEKTHFETTRNLFNLPLCLQYGVGSTGFGVKREILAHEISTKWALENECSNFPLLYHWRVLPRVQSNQSMSNEEAEKLDKDVQYWNGSETVRDRLLAIHNSEDDVYLFLEWFPWNLDEWLSQQVKTDLTSAVAAIARVLGELLSTTDFMKSKGFIHFDAHFRNILTDGHSIYFSDFGLATSEVFELSADESAFFQRHVDYDTYFVLANLIYGVLTTLARKENPDSPWLGFVKDFKLSGALETTPRDLAEIFLPYSAVAERMSRFLVDLLSDRKTVFPHQELGDLWKVIAPHKTKVVWKDYNVISEWFDTHRDKTLIMEQGYLNQITSLVPKGGTILDLGCGTGEPIGRYFIQKGFSLTGVDGSFKMIELCKNRFPQSEWIVSDMRTIGLDKKFDAIIAWHSLFHLDHHSQRSLFGVVAEHLKAGGIFAFTSGDQHGEVWSDNGGKELYHASLAPEEYENLLTSSSFQILRHVTNDPTCGGATVWIVQKIS